MMSSKIEGKNLSLEKKTERELPWEEKGGAVGFQRERGELGKIPKAGSKPVAKKDWNRVARV